MYLCLDSKVHRAPALDGRADGRHRQRAPEALLQVLHALFNALCLDGGERADGC